jgi:hypothetical protein
MIDPRIKLTVLHDDNGSFADLSEDACDFSRDTFGLALNASEDYLYIGFRKPIQAAYVELATANTNANTMAAEYYNGTTWTTLTVRDETKGFTRSGFITWDRALPQSTSVNGTASYWVRFRPSVTHSATVVRGINLVFCDDNSLKQEFYDIDDTSLIPSGQSSHIMSHVAARNSIVQELRNRGYIITTEDGTENVNQWDLLDVYEIQEAAKYKALALIFFMLSDSQEDNWYAKHREYSDKHKAVLKGLKLSVDENDDGVKDEDEDKVAVKVTRWTY